MSDWCLLSTSSTGFSPFSISPPSILDERGGLTTLPGRNVVGKDGEEELGREIGEELPVTEDEKMEEIQLEHGELYSRGRDAV